MAAALCVVHTSLYFGLNAAFLLCDHFGFLASYKLPRTPSQLPSLLLLQRTIIPQAVLQLTLLPLLTWYAVLPLYERAGAASVESPLPSVLEVYASFLGCALTNQFGFYWAHRALHESPALYRAIHKQHHQYVGSIGFAAEYAHPVEAVLANMLPTMGFCVAFGVHPLVFVLWFSWRLEETYEAHSGYCFSNTWLGRVGLLHGHHASHHDFHHSRNVGNYGSAFTDGLFGTMGAWLDADGEAGLWALKDRQERKRL